MDGIASFLGSAGPRVLSKGQPSHRASPMSPSQSIISRWGWGFHVALGDIDQADHRIRLWANRIAEVQRCIKILLMRG